MRVLLLVVLGLIASCDASDQQAAHGHLYFAAGSYVGLFDLSDGGSAPVANLGDVTIDHISAYESSDLLLTMRDFANKREISRILRFNPRQNTSFPLFPGLQAEFLGPRDQEQENSHKRLARNLIAMPKEVFSKDTSNNLSKN